MTFKRGFSRFRMSTLSIVEANAPARVECATFLNDSAFCKRDERCSLLLINI